MKNHFYIIKYDEVLKIWHRLHPQGYTLKQAEKLKLTYPEGQYDVIHEMWLDCLTEWPSPNYMNEEN